MRLCRLSSYEREKVTIELSNREFYLLTALIVWPALHSLKLMFKTLSHGRPKRGKSMPRK